MFSRFRRILQRSEAATAALLFLAPFLVYVANGRVLGSGDTIPAKYLPLSILREFNFDLDEFPFLYDPVIPYFLQYQNGHVVSAYPVGPALLAVPVYALPILLGTSAESLWLSHLEKFTAAAIAALSVLFLYFALKRLASPKAVAIVTGIYAFGTSTFSVSSQALWQHGPSQLFLAMGLYFLVRGLNDPRFTAYAGLPLAAAIACRPTDLLIVLPIAIYVVHTRRDQLFKFVLCSLPPALFLGWYNATYFGSPFLTGYGREAVDPFSSFWGAPFLDGLLGLLISPRAGLLVYSPIFVLSFLGMLDSWKKGGCVLLKYLSLGPLLTILLYSKRFAWWGGLSYGPRYLADLAPILALFLLPGLLKIQRIKPLRLTVWALALISVGLHGLGAFAYDGSWDVHFKDWTAGENHLWSWSKGPIVYYTRQSFAAAARRVLRPPDSLSASTDLAAAYVIRNVSLSAPTSTPIALSLKVRNTGGALWLRRTSDGRGEVHLSWRWLKDGVEVPHASGREFLTYDVLPGQRHKFRVRIWPPPEPGKYLLELGMVNELVAFFQDLGSPPVKIPLSITGDSLCNANAVLNKLVVGAAHGLVALNLATDKAVYRTGDVLQARLRISNSGSTRLFLLYVILQWPNEDLYFFDLVSSTFSNYRPCQPWLRSGLEVRLPSHFQWDNYVFGLWLKDMPLGTYTFYTVLADADGSALTAAAKSTATFVLQP